MSTKQPIDSSVGYKLIHVSDLYDRYKNNNLNSWTYTLSNCKLQFLFDLVLTFFPSHFQSCNDDNMITWVIWLLVKFNVQMWEGSYPRNPMEMSSCSFKVSTDHRTSWPHGGGNEGWGWHQTWGGALIKAQALITGWPPVCLTIR